MARFGAPKAPAVPKGRSRSVKRVSMPRVKTTSTKGVKFLGLKAGKKTTAAKIKL